MASQRDLAKQLLQRASDDEAAAKAMLPIEAVTDAAGALRYDAEDPKLVDRKTSLLWATTAVTWARAQLEPAEAGGR
jgi:alkylhydroperoxidase family enzyme